MRLIRSMKDENSTDRNNQIPLYAVEEIHDGSASLPPTWMLRLPGNGRCPIATLPAKTPMQNNDKDGGNSGVGMDDSGREEGVYRDDNHINAIRNLSLRSSTPVIAYQGVWPWRLCKNICKLIQETPDFEGLKSILHSAAGLQFEDDGNNMQATSTNEAPTVPSSTQFQVVDPSAFANWIATNIPLSQNDNFDILQMTCTVQQLRYILQKLEKKKLLRCKHCGAVISQMRYVFSVGGSEGTTGAYVNEHGVVHQTVTLRKVDSHSAVCIGRPETRDSWFPGYSWTIAYCSICSDHLGWKFRRVGRSDEEDPDRPRTFWGFSSITTDEHVRPRRVSFHTRRALAALLHHD